MGTPSEITGVGARPWPESVYLVQHRLMLLEAQFACDGSKHQAPRFIQIVIQTGTVYYCYRYSTQAFNFK